MSIPESRALLQEGDGVLVVLLRESAAPAEPAHRFGVAEGSSVRPECGQEGDFAVLEWPAYLLIWRNRLAPRIKRGVPVGDFPVRASFAAVRKDAPAGPLVEICRNGAFRQVLDGENDFTVGLGGGGRDDRRRLGLEQRQQGGENQRPGQGGSI